MSTLGEGRLANKIALLTGAASGSGRACARRYAEEGADVVIAGRDAARGAAVAAEIEAASNRRALFVPVDVADEDSIEAMAALYLACEQSSCTTGHTLYPNGGMFVG